MSNRSLFNKTLSFCTLLCSFFVFGMATDASAQYIAEWGYSSFDDGDNSASGTLIKNNATIIGDSVQLGGAIVSGNGNHVIFDSKININDSALEAIDTSIAIIGGSSGLDREGISTGNQDNKLIDNEITFVGSKLKAAVYLSFEGGIIGTLTGSHTLTGNSVSISGKSEVISGSRAYLYGGRVFGIGSHTLTGNSVSISEGSTLTSGFNIILYGGSADGTGNHTVTNNSVSISEGSTLATGFNIIFYGGSADADDTGNHAVTNNSVSISDSTLKSTRGLIQLYGGYADGTGNHSVTNNSLTLSGTVGLTAPQDVTLSGSNLDTDTSDGNSLHLDGATVTLESTDGVHTSTVQNFENYKFTPTYDQMMNPLNIPMLTADKIDLGGADATIKFGALPADTPIIPISTEFTLLKADGGHLTGTFRNIDETHTLQQGTTRVYDVKTTIDVATGTLRAKITSVPKAQN